MNYDIIKLLNLESINIDLDKSMLVKEDNTIIYNVVLKTSKIIDMYPSRHYYTLLQNFQRISLLERENVKYFIMDMWEPYKRAVLDCFPNALIAVDSFHILQHLNIAVDMVRLRTMRRFDRGYAKLENADMYYYMLKKFHLFFKTPFAKIDEKLFDVNKLKTKWDKYTILGYLKGIDSELTKAYNLAEDYRDFNYYCDLNNFEEDFENLVFKFSNSNIPEFYEFVKMIKRWKQEIKNSFIFINNKRLSNGKIEGCNSRLKILYKAANGYANFDRFRNRCMFVINKDTPIKNHHK